MVISSSKMSGMQRKTLFEKMVLIRVFEEAILEMFSQARISGTTHTCIGQEAIAVALGANLSGEDYLFCPHRCHGHFIAYGGSPEALMAEIMGRETGVCQGRGGSQHLHFRRFFSNGVQGGIVGNAVGAALACKLARTDSIAVAVLGDGTMGEGLVYESFNFAALQGLPILFLVENNHYAQTTPERLALSGSIVRRAQAFGIDADETQATDVVDLYRLFKERVHFIRKEQKPFLQVVDTYRLCAHSKGDDNRDPDELRRHWQEDPLVLNGLDLEQAVRDEILARARETVTGAIEKSDAAPVSSQLVIVNDEDKGGGCAFPIAFPEMAETCQKLLNKVLHGLLHADPCVLFMGEDVLDPYGGAFGVAKGLSTRYVDRVITSPISEAGLVAWGTGAALAGMRPVIEIMFGDFLSLAADQLLNHAAKYRWISGEQVRVPLVIRTPMGGGRGYGPTHSQSIEKMFLGIPGLTVVAVNSLLDPGELLQRSVRHSLTPVLFIEHKLLYATTIFPVKDGRLGHFYIHISSSKFPTAHLSLAAFDPPDVCMYCYGGMTPVVMEAAYRLLVEYEIMADIVVPSQLYPLPTDELAASARHARTIVTVEEGQGAAGWGAEVVASLVERNAICPERVIRVSAEECPVPASRSLEQNALPSVQKIIDAIMGSS